MTTETNLAPLCYLDARNIAQAVKAMIRPVCDEVTIAGSVRRAEAVCNDIELVCVPRMTPRNGKPLFDDCDPELVSALDRFTNALGTTGDLILDPTTKRNGPRYKRFLAFGTVPVDLFIVRPPAEWGALLAIRTGPAEFSRLLVTKRRAGGAMPDDLDQRDGALWRGFHRLETPTEEAYFEAIGVPYLHPAQRSETRLVRLLPR